jgi:hypothetical protein
MSSIVHTLIVGCQFLLLLLSLLVLARLAVNGMNITAVCNVTPTHILRSITFFFFPRKLCLYEICKKKFQIGAGRRGHDAFALHA